MKSWSAGSGECLLAHGAILASRGNLEQAEVFLKASLLRALEAARAAAHAAALHSADGSDPGCRALPPGADAREDALVEDDGGDVRGGSNRRSVKNEFSQCGDNPWSETIVSKCSRYTM